MTSYSDEMFCPNCFTGRKIKDQQMIRKNNTWECPICKVILSLDYCEGFWNQYWDEHFI